MIIVIGDLCFSAPFSEILIENDKPYLVIKSYWLIKQSRN